MADFNFTELDLKGAYLIDNPSVGDIRGSFTKCFEKNIFYNNDINFQLNETFISVSEKNVIRGLHFQIHNPQAKLISVPYGRVYDVIVDLRPQSETFKKWVGVELSNENHRTLYVPRGFAHGFAALETNTIMMYQCDGTYNKETDTGIRFDDPIIGVEWPVNPIEAIHSDRDLQLMSFKEYIKGVLDNGKIS